MSAVMPSPLRRFTRYARLAKRVAVLVALAGIASCDTNNNFAPGVVGSFRIETVNGLRPPALLVRSNPESDLLIDDTFTLNSDNTYKESGLARTTLATGAVATIPIFDFGFYANNGGALILTSHAGNGSFTGTVSGDRLTITKDGTVLVYAR